MNRSPPKRKSLSPKQNPNLNVNSDNNIPDTIQENENFPFVIHHVGVKKKRRKKKLKKIFFI